MSGSDRPKSNRTLGWNCANEELIQVCDMEDLHLLNCIRLMRRRVMGAKLITGVTSLSFLAYQYLVDEAKERGLDVEDYHAS